MACSVALAEQSHTPDKAVSHPNSPFSVSPRPPVFRSPLWFQTTPFRPHQRYCMWLSHFLRCLGPLPSPVPPPPRGQLLLTQTSGTRLEERDTCSYFPFYLAAVRLQISLNPDKFLKGLEVELSIDWKHEISEWMGGRSHMACLSKKCAPQRWRNTTRVQGDVVGSPTTCKKGKQHSVTFSIRKWRRTMYVFIHSNRQDFLSYLQDGLWVNCKAHVWHCKVLRKNLCLKPLYSSIFILKSKEKVILQGHDPSVSLFDSSHILPPSSCDQALPSLDRCPPGWLFYTHLFNIYWEPNMCQALS